MKTETRNKLSLKQLKFIDANNITVIKETKSTESEPDNYLFFINGEYIQQRGSHSEYDAFLKAIEYKINSKKR